MKDVINNYLSPDYDKSLAAHLREEERAEAWDEAVEERACSLFTGDYSPSLPGNIYEAFGEFPESLCAKLAPLVPSSLDDIPASASAFGQLVLEELFFYWSHAAEAQAATELETERRKNIEEIGE